MGLSILVAVLLMSFTGIQARADVISQEMAMETAHNFLSLDSDWNGTDDATVNLVEEEGVPAYYIIEYSKGGWAIVAAQSTSTPIIGYSTTGCYAAPEPMQAVLKANAQAIADAARTEDNATHERWEQIIQRRPVKTSADYPDVEPLIKCDLNQVSPFNSQCPDINGKRAVVGCVAVGMVQAMMVQQYPYAPQGSHSYDCPGIGLVSIDYDQVEPYDWDAVLNSKTTGDYDEVARILYHSGVAVGMYYGVAGSGAYWPDVYKAFSRNFGYSSKKIALHYKKDYSTSGWLKLLLNDIQNGRAVVYFGSSETIGHCWNIDGWKNSTQMVHVNWGWGGIGNGYFDIESMHDTFQGQEFPLNNSAIVGVGAPLTAPYGVKLSNTRFVEGTAAGVALADVTVFCKDSEANFTYDLRGPKNITGNNIVSPYEVVDGKLVSSQTVENKTKFTYLSIQVTNENTGESVEEEFNIHIGANNAVEVVESNALRLYPTVAEQRLTVEVPVVGGKYAIYSLSGAQVATGTLTDYKSDIAIESLAAGTYIVRYEHSEGVCVKRFVKK